MALIHKCVFPGVQRDNNTRRNSLSSSNHAIREQEAKRILVMAEEGGVEGYEDSLRIISSLLFSSGWKPELNEDVEA